MSAEKGPARITPLQRIAREAVRGVGHYPFFRVENVHAAPDGLQKAHEILSERKGLLVVEPHFAGVDPLWVANAITRKKGFRSVPISGPIRADRAFPGLIPVAKAAGFDLTRVTTPDQFEEMLRNGSIPREEKSALKESFIQQYDNYIASTTNTLSKGGVVVLAQSAHRQPRLTRDRYQVVSGVVDKIISNEVTDFGIHFAACEIPGEKDYSKRRGFNVGTKYRVRHGETFTAEELVNMANVNIDPALDEKKYRRALMRNMDNIVYDNLFRIAPEAYLPAEQ